MCASIQAYIFVSVCACMRLWNVYVHNIMCSAQQEVAAVLDWYGPEADPAYWQRGREDSR